MLLKSCYFAGSHKEGKKCTVCEDTIREIHLRKDELFTSQPPPTDPGLELANRFPKYWKTLPAHWQAIDTYRINELFPVTGDNSGRILHSRKKLLVPGVRTGGKSLNVDISEAYATLGAWLDDNQKVDYSKLTEAIHDFKGAIL